MAEGQNTNHYQLNFMTMNDMKMNRYMLAALLCMMLLVGPWQSHASEAQYTLEEAVLAGLEANPDVESAQLMLAQSKLEVKRARGGFLPSVTFQSSYTDYNQSGDAGTVDDLDRTIATNQLTISQPLFDGLLMFKNYSQAKIQKDIDAAKLRQARLDLIYYIQEAFLQLLKAREDLTTIRDEIVRIKEQLAASKVFYDAGIGPNNDVLKNEVELSKAYTDEIKVKNRIKNYTTMLNTFLAVGLGADVAYLGDLRGYVYQIDYTEDTAMAAALDHRPDVFIEKKNLEVAKKEGGAIASRYMPTITLEYTKAFQDMDFDSKDYDDLYKKYDTIGVNLTWRLFEGGKTTYQYMGNLKRIKALEKSMETQIADAKKAIVNALTNIEDAKKWIDYSIRARKNARENYKMESERYKTGVGAIADLLMAQQRLSQAEADQSDAYMQYQIAKAALFYFMGIENAGLN